MRTLLVIAGQSGLGAAVRAVLSTDRYRVVAVNEWQEAGAFLTEGMADALILDAELTNIQPLRIIEQVRARLPHCPILVFAAATQWEWEEEAWLLGINHLLAKPVRGRLLNLLLDRLWDAPAPTGSAPPVVCPRAEPKPPAPQHSLHTLEVLRQFSAVLTHSLRADPLLKEFLMLLREILGVNRAAIFLRRPPTIFKGDLSPLEDRRLHAACGLGLTAGLLQHFELSLDAGIGWFAHRAGRVLRRGSEEALASRETQKEFELLGAQVAIPILDREALVGVAVFDGPVTGETFGNEELALIFHLLEDLGLAIRNSWLHDQFVANHQVMLEVLDQVRSACVLVGPKLEVIHANQAALGLFGRQSGGRVTLEFNDLPPALGSMIYAVLQPGAEAQQAKHRLPQTPNRLFRAAATPIRRAGASTATALLVAEDFTEEDRTQQLEVEAARLRLVRSMAEHLAHEIGNALAPLSTHQQMLAGHHAEPEFIASLSDALQRGVKRISRLSSQMRYLAGERPPEETDVPVRALIADAMAEARSHLDAPAPELKLVEVQPPLGLRGDRVALTHALAEVLLNAVQASTGAPAVELHVCGAPEHQPAWLELEIVDTGPGFSSESLRHATEPFFSTKTVGVGLGLIVARRILEAHQGGLEILSGPGQAPGRVRLRLPLAQSMASPATSPIR